MQPAECEQDVNKKTKVQEVVWSILLKSDLYLRYRIEDMITPHY